MSRKYVNNAQNRRLGRVGMSVGSMPVSRGSSGSSNVIDSSTQRTYVDNDQNRRLGRVGISVGSMPVSRGSSGSSNDSCSQRTYVDRAQYGSLGRVGMPVGSMPVSRGSFGSSFDSSSQRTYVDHAQNGSLERVGMPVWSMSMSRGSFGSSYDSSSQRTYVDHAQNGSLERVGMLVGSMPVSRGSFGSSYDFKMRVFTEGEVVRAKWPGSRLWYKAKILEVLKDGYKIRFEDGTEKEMASSHVSAEGRFRRSRSRSSSKFPSRRRSRSRSPLRRPKHVRKKTPSPARAQTVVSVTKRVETRTKKSVDATPSESSQTRLLPRRLITPTVTQSRTEHRSYTTRSATRSGQLTLDLPTDFTMRSAVPKTKHYEFGGPIDFKMRVFTEGEAVRAKWPGSQLWYKAKILEVLKDGYKIRFEDGTEEEMASSHVSAEGRFRRSRSRSSSKSPSRRRSQSRSPARSPKQVQKKTPSPARTQTKVVSVTKQVETRTKKAVDAVPSESSQTQSLPRRLNTPSKTQNRTEHRTYTTRSATRSGQQTLEPSIDLKMRSAFPKTKHEFGGPVGVFLLMFLLPLVVYYLHFVCTKKSCQLVLYPAFSKEWRDYFDLNAALIVFGWIVFHIVIYFIPVGRIIQGLPLRSGKRLKYYENAFYALMLSLALCGLMVYYKKPFVIVIEKYLALITAALVLSVVLSVALYIKFKQVPSSELAPSGNSGNFFYDFFMGHELNPRIGMFDFKYVIGVRPGTIGWVILDHIFLFTTWKDFPNNPPLPLLLLTLFHTLYVADALWFEADILSIMEIVTEGFGFALVFAGLVWVPFICALQARYLSMHPPNMPNNCLGIAVAFNLTGYYIYRSANGEKNRFRKNPYSPSVSDLETISTSSGKKLLVSGWWGFVRRPNYLGDIIMAFSWAFLCGFDSFVPYFYPIYLMLLLIHREYRDSQSCRQKHDHD